MSTLESGFLDAAERARNADSIDSAASVMREVEALISLLRRHGASGGRLRHLLRLRDTAYLHASQAVHRTANARLGKFSRPDGYLTLPAAVFQHAPIGPRGACALDPAHEAGSSSVIDDIGTVCGSLAVY